MGVVHPAAAYPWTGLLFFGFVFFFKYEIFFIGVLALCAL